MFEFTIVQADYVEASYLKSMTLEELSNLKKPLIVRNKGKCQAILFNYEAYLNMQNILQDALDRFQLIERLRSI